MSGRVQVCRQFRDSGSCRFGNKCRFSHDSPDSNSRGASPGPSSPVAPRSPTRTRNNVPAQGGGGDHAPRNVCDFYWNVGKCNRGFDCTYRHEQKTNNGSIAAPDNKTASEDAPNVALDYFTADSLAETAGIQRNENHVLKPGDAHNMIKVFLRDGYVFGTPGNMQSFVRILASINRRNKAWVSTLLFLINANLLTPFRTRTAHRYDKQKSMDAIATNGQYRNFST